MLLKRVTVSILSLSIAINPVWAQTAAPANQVVKNLEIDAQQTHNYARLIFKWQSPKADKVKTKITNSLLELELPVETNADPLTLKSKAADFVVGSVMSNNKRTIRLALAKDVRVETSKVGNYDVVDLILKNTASPEPFDPNAIHNGSESLTAEEVLNSKPKNTLNQKLVNRPAPVGAKVLAVDSSESKLFTRVSILGANTEPLYARKGNRIALTIPGLFALDVGSIRVSPPNRVKDLVRYNDNKYTSLVMDIEPGAVVRHGREGSRAYVDIFPAGTNLENIEDTEAYAKEKLKSASKTTENNKKANSHDAENVDGNPNANGIPDAGDHAQNASYEKKTIGSIAGNDSAAAHGSNDFSEADIAPPPFSDPQPSGRVNVVTREKQPNYILDFEFENNAPAAIFRRGANIYVLFGTKANFNAASIKPNEYISGITPVKGDGVSGVKITAPDGVYASPSQLGKHWLVTLSKKSPQDMRTIAVQGERAADGSNRLKAKTMDAVTTGTIEDKDVGDNLLIGLAYGPPSSVINQRSYLEATFIPTFHGVAVVPRADDLNMLLALDGYVVQRPSGLILSDASEMAGEGEFAARSPGMVDFVKWKLGPQADYIKNLSKLRAEAAKEVGDPSKGIKAQLNLARFYVAWEMGEEALGVTKSISATNPDQSKTPELIALMGIAQSMIGRGREALETLSAPELLNDAASHLWAAQAALDSGNPTEARRHFAEGQSALIGFSKDYQAKFLLNEAIASAQLGDIAGAEINAKKAEGLATDPHIKELAKLYSAKAIGDNGDVDTAIGILNELGQSKYADVSARAKYYMAMLENAKNPEKRNDAIKILDSLRYAWRGDDLEIDILRNLGELYIQAGDIRSGLSTLAYASTLRPDLQASRDLRDVLANEFKHLFLEGGADGMDSVQALALFYDFRNLTPVGPEGDQMVRGLANKLVGLDLLPQAEELLQYQVNRRLQGFTKAQVGTDLAAIYLMDNKPEMAMKTVNATRIGVLPDDLNKYRRIIEAIALTDLGRHEHAVELIEFDNSVEADKLRTEAFWRMGNMEEANKYANKNLPRPAMKYSPEAASDILRAALAKSLSGDRDGTVAMNRTYGTGMNNSAFAPAFKVITSEDVPTQDSLKAAVDSVRGASPFYGVIKDLRKNIAKLQEPTQSEIAQNINFPTDANPNAFKSAGNSFPSAENNKQAAVGGTGNNAPINAPVNNVNRVAQKPAETIRKNPFTPKPKQSQQASNNPQRNANVAAKPKVNNNNASNNNPRGIQAPKDPPISAVGR